MKLMRIELLDTNSCRGTVPMQPPMSNSPMGHRVGTFKLEPMIRV